MASKFSYQRLRQEVIFEEDDRRKVTLSLGGSRQRFNWLGPLRLGRRRRKFRIKIPRLRRFFKVRKTKVSWLKFIKRLKESRSHWGDLFAGNYLFMQVAPTAFNKNRIEKICNGLHHYHQQQNSNNNNNNNNGSKYKIPAPGGGFPNPRYIVA